MLKIQQFRFLTLSKPLAGLLFLIFWIALTPQFLNGQQAKPEDMLKKVSEDVYMLNEMSINTANGTIEIPCKINMNKGLIEVVLCRKEGKVHESLLVTNISPLEFQTALLLLGLDPVNEVPDDPSKIDQSDQFSSIETEGDAVKLYLAYELNGEMVKKPIEHFVYDESVQKKLKPSTWLFRGAATHMSGHVMVDPDVTMIATYHDPVAMMELNAQSKFNDELFYVDENAKLTIGKKVTLIVEKI